MSINTLDKPQSMAYIKGMEDNASTNHRIQSMSNATTYTITVGLESPELTVDQARDAALTLAGIHFPSGHTIVDATGRWESPERGIVDEPSLIITVIGEGQAHRAAVGKFCHEYKAAASQDAVLLQITKPETYWI